MRGVANAPRRPVPGSHRPRAFRRPGRLDPVARIFEPFVLRVVRFAMRKQTNYRKIRSRLGSSDICQSVFKSLFVGLKEGRFELNQPEQLQNLLRIMSRFKIATEGRRLSVILREVMDEGSPPIRLTPVRAPKNPSTTRILPKPSLDIFPRMSWKSCSEDSTVKPGP